MHCHKNNLSSLVLKGHQWPDGFEVINKAVRMFVLREQVATFLNYYYFIFFEGTLVLLVQGQSTGYSLTIPHSSHRAWLPMAWKYVCVYFPINNAWYYFCVNCHMLHNRC